MEASNQESANPSLYKHIWRSLKIKWTWKILCRLRVFVRERKLCFKIRILSWQHYWDIVSQYLGLSKGNNKI